jgi:hypothetical protein
MAQIPQDPDLRQLPIGELVKQLAEETSTLVRQELELAKAEMTQKGKQAGLGLGELGGAALALAMPVWLAALIVAVVYGIIASVLALIGRRQLQQGLPPTPERTQQTVKEDIEWAKTLKK